MTRKRKPNIRKPTNAELEVLSVLWERGSSTVRDVLENLPPGRDPGYTTVLKTMQLMLEKGLLVREGDRRPHLYAPRHEREVIERLVVDDLMRGPFRGAATNLVMHALQDEDVSPETLDEIQRLIQSEKKRRQS